ncbi:hypothetical protein [Nocardia araoensis]|uniref:hypothetical protein n=1 Tax=Nocardia araoensis TaxID=228600 RepID=UPI00030C5068|nr:hypothetical protein [Nocardia araoensis]
MSSGSRQPVSEETVHLFMDYGQFRIDGGVDSPVEELELLDRALAAHPFASDGLAVVVLSPHQNNFHMPVTIQVWDERPPGDRAEWQQVCETRLRVGPEGTLCLSSPTDGAVDCPVPEGEYLIEISGRGFVDYGWPGTTEPGDVWRIRLWPDDGSEPLPAVQWDMPGYGVPENVPLHDVTASVDDAEEWVVVVDDKGSHRLHIDELQEQAAAFQRRRWGGDPISRLEDCPGAEELARHDRAIAEAVAAMGDPELRRLARWSAAQACTKAGLTDRPWVRPALAALREGRPLPPPFDDAEGAMNRLHDEDFGPPDDEHVGTIEATMVLGSTGAAANPFDLGPIHRPSFALPTIIDANQPDALDAAMTTLYATGLVFGPEVDALFAALRAEFGIG